MPKALGPPFPLYLTPSLPCWSTKSSSTAASGQTALTTQCPATLTCLTCANHLAYTAQIVSKGFTGRHGRAYLVSLDHSTRSVVAGVRTSTTTDRAPVERVHRQTLLNTYLGRAVNRDLLTGLHVVADVTCAGCDTVVGWKYVDAREAGQRYKVGKFILERKLVGVVTHWEDGEVGGGDGDDWMGDAWGPGLREKYGHEMQDGLDNNDGDGDGDDDGAIEFDSQDEDECDHLFAGTWDAHAVGKRRRAARGKTWSS